MDTTISLNAPVTAEAAESATSAVSQEQREAAQEHQVPLKTPTPSLSRRNSSPPEHQVSQPPLSRQNSSSFTTQEASEGRLVAGALQSSQLLELPTSLPQVFEAAAVADDSPAAAMGQPGDASQAESPAGSVQQFGPAPGPASNEGSAAAGTAGGAGTLDGVEQGCAEWQQECCKAQQQCNELEQQNRLDPGYTL